MALLLIAGGRMVASVWSGIVTLEEGRIRSDERLDLVESFGETLGLAVVCRAVVG